jgi:predicted protein tyrosine phosphatase
LEGSDFGGRGLIQSFVLSAFGPKIQHTLWDRGVMMEIVMPTVLFMSRTSAAEFDPPHGAVIIAIRNPRNAPLELEGWADILHLDFHDIDAPYEDFHLFTFKQAGQLCDFVAKHRDMRMIAAHCDYGVSRSAAVALFVSRLLRSSLVEDVAGHNKLVFRRLKVAWLLRRLKGGELRLAIEEYKTLGGCAAGHGP